MAQGLTAAGIAVLFIVELAAVHLYHLIGAPTGFALLALTTATAVALSLRHGVMVALLGLVGGFLTPALMSTGQPNAKMLFGYLALLQAGLLTVSRRRGWAALAGLTLLGALGWAFGWSVSSFALPDAAAVGVFLVVSVGGALLATLGSGTRWGAPLSSWVHGAAAAGALLVAVVLAGRTGFGLLEWGFVGLLAAACLVLARLAPAMEGLAWLAAGAVCVLLGDWARGLEAADAPRFFSVAAAALLLLASGAWALQRGAPRPARWAALAATTTLAVDLIAYEGARVAALDLPWGWIELGLAALWVVLALPVARQRAARAGAEGALAAAVAIATTLVSLAVPMELAREWLAVAWALEVTALVWLAARLRVPLLALLAAVLTAVVGVSLLNPTVLDYPTGSHPLLSWLLYGYGVPVVSLALAAGLARRHQGDIPRARALAAAIGGVAVALAVAFLALAARQAFHPGHLTVGDVTAAELGALTTLWLVLACGLLAAAVGRPYPELHWGGAIVACLAIAQAFLFQGLVANPLWSDQAVGAT
ncbi:MAG TPA: DUF2339 domain-containing protein, partial [Thermoanaerobaculia bacterium]|nr:DUF2339 domain-containing protein [Thermoanaerobaculia bacterium]